MDTSQKQIIKNFESLSDFEKKIFAVIFIYYLPTPASRFPAIFSAFKIFMPGDNRKILGPDVGKLCEIFASKKLITWEVGKPIEIDLKVDKTLYTHAFIQKIYEQYGERILYKVQKEKEEMGRWRMIHSGYKNIFMMSCFRYVLQNQNISCEEKKEKFTKFYKKNFRETVSEYYDEKFFDQEDEEIFWKNLYTVANFEDILPIIPADKKQNIFHALKWEILYGESSIVENQQIIEKYPEEFLEIILLQGKFSQVAKNVITTPVNAYNLDIRGMQNFFQGKNSEAKKYFAQSLVAFKKQSHKRVNFSPYLGGIFYIILLLQEDLHISKNSLFIHKWIHYGIDAQNIFSPIYQSLEDLFFFEKEEEIQQKKYFNFSEYSRSNCIEFLICAVIENRVSRENFEKNLPQWETKSKQWKEKGFKYIADQVSKLHKNDQNSPFIFQKNIAQPWEKTMHFLENIASISQKSQQKSAQNSRIAWEIEDHYSDIKITPKFQKQNKNGTWSKGRNIALKKLSQGIFFSAPVTTQDQKVIACIKSYQSNSYYGGTEYFMDNDSAIVQLTGHPSAIAEDGKLVTIEKKNPELVIKKGKNFIYLSFSQKIPAQAGTSISQESKHWYTITQITEDHVIIAQKLKYNKTLPLDAEEKLQKILGGLSKIIPLQSDISGDSATIITVEPNSILQIHLKRVDDGFLAECFVEPIEKSQKFFHPGKGRENILIELAGKDIQTQRNILKEKSQYKKILSSSLVLQEQEEKPFIFHSSSTFEALELIEELKKIQEKNSKIIQILWPEGEALKLQQSISSKNFSLSITKSEQNWFELSGKIFGGADGKQKIIEMKELLQKVKDTDSRFLEMGNNEFWALSEELFAQLKQIDGISQDGKFHALATPLIEDSLEDFPKIRSDKFWKDQQKKWDQSYKKKYTIPKTLQADLRDYQKQGVEWMSRLGDMGMGACLADDMGLGKTLQGIAMLLKKADKGASLVVAPVSVIPNWKSEIEKFSPTLNPIILTGTPQNRIKLLKKLKPFDIVLCSYGTLAPDQKNLEKITWQTLILDEAQAIKNHTTKRSKAAFALQSEQKIITTGTPMENHLGELWSLFRFLNPGFLGEYKNFTENFLIPIEKDPNSPQKKHLKNLITPFLLRRKKSEVLRELPEKTQITLSLEMDEKEKIFYEALRQKAVENIETDDEKNAGSKHLKVLAEIMKLRQGCCHSKLVDKKLEIPSTKLEKLSEILDELKENGHKVLIFSQFVGYLKIIKNFLETKKISYQYLDGSTPMKKREKSVQDFQNGESDAFLISLKAGGSGLNLTAANYVIHMDPWWNPAVEDQASDRAHRIGQKQKVTIYRFVTKDTIEEKIIAMHKTKRDLADSLLEGTSKAKKISTDELLTLLKGV